MIGLKLIHVSKRGNWWSNHPDTRLVVSTINYLCKTFPHVAIKVQCFLTTINLTLKFQLMVHEKLSWRNCKCPVDLWQPGQIALKKFHHSKKPDYRPLYIRSKQTYPLGAAGKFPLSRIGMLESPSCSNCVWHGKQYGPWNMHMAVPYFPVIISKELGKFTWTIYPYHSGILHCCWGNYEVQMK